MRQQPAARREEKVPGAVYQARGSGVPVGASLLALDANDNARHLNDRVVLWERACSRKRQVRRHRC
ncbi:hypothetical protein EMIT0P218_320016 [Pseudomonas sp. IT-P218]